jgi:ATP-dependent helicase HrpB
MLLLTMYQVRHVGARPLAMVAAGHPREVEAEVADAVASVLREVSEGDV